jgi:hypothetical protein
MKKPSKKKAREWWVTVFDGGVIFDSCGVIFDSFGSKKDALDDIKWRFATKCGQGERRKWSVVHVKEVLPRKRK